MHNKKFFFTAGLCTGGHANIAIPNFFVTNLKPFVFQVVLLGIFLHKSQGNEDRGMDVLSERRKGGLGLRGVDIMKVLVFLKSNYWNQ